MQMNSQDDNLETHCGFIAIVGRPNVGKSTLMNAILGEKISITSFRPQTTRHQILGIHTEGNHQMVFVDTPGLHLNAKKSLNKEMNRIAQSALIDVDAILFVVEAMVWTNEDQWVLNKIKDSDKPIFIMINKVDLIKEKGQLLSYMQQLQQQLPKAQLVPVSALKRIQIDVLRNLILPLLPKSPFYYEKTQKHQHSQNFYISEVVREKTMRLLEKELPYSTTVVVEKMEECNSVRHIHALIWVEREGQKGIVVGDGGQMLKNIGMQARKDLERYFDQKICLKLWVKVKENWSESNALLQQMVYGQ